MDKLRALQYFVAAADARSFAGAARQLDVSVPSIHKLVTSLESQLGIRLFDRSVRGLTLTASGAAYLESCRPLLDELSALDQAVSRSAVRPSGIVVVGLPPQLAHHFLLPALPSFHSRYPELQIDVRIVHRTTDVDATGVDVFVLHGWPDVADLVHRRLGHARALVAASAGYWRQHGLPQRPQDLAQHPCVLLRNPVGILLDLWEFERGVDKASVKVGGWLCSNDREVVLHAVLAGEGVGRFSELASRGLLESGQLVPALTDWQMQGGPPLNLLYRSNHGRSPAVRLFLDFVAELLHDVESASAGRLQGGPVERPQWYRRGYSKASSVLRWRQ